MSYLSLSSLTPAQLNRAAAIKEKIEVLNRELAELLGVPESSLTGKAPRKKSKFSPAGIARIRAAQKARWARIKGIIAAAPGKPVKARKTDA